MLKTLKTLILLSILFWYPIIYGSSENPTIDSLKQSLKMDISDERRVRKYLDLTSAYYSIHKDSCYNYNAKAISLAKKIDYKNGLYRAQNNHGLMLCEEGHTDSALSFLSNILPLRTLGIDSVLIMATYQNIGIAHSYNADYMKSIENFRKATNFASGREGKYTLPRIFVNIGIMYSQNSLFPEALKNLIKSASLAKEQQNFRIEAIALAEAATVFSEMGENDSALHYYQEALQIAEATDQNETKSRVYWSIAQLYNDIEDYESSLNYAIKAKDILEAMNKQNDLPGCYCLLGSIYSKRKNFNLSNYYFTEFEKANKKTGSVYEESQCYSWWAASKKEQGNYKSAVKYYEEYIILQDSFFTQEHKATLSELQTKYETTQKEAQIEKQNFEIEKNELTIKKKNIQNIGLLSALLGLLSVLGFAFYSYQQKIRLKEEKIKTVEREQELNSFKAMVEGEEKERVRVARDLHDGIGAMLGALSMKMSGLKEENELLKSSNKFSQIIKGIDDTNDEVRRISHNLIPAVLLQFGLIKALEDHFGRINQSNLLNIDFQHYGIDNRLSQRIELTVYRIIQELINNIVKYAEAKKAIVQLNRNNGTLSITIEDDGKGLDWNKIENTKGIGIENLKSRIEALKGNFNIDAKQEVGTSVYIEIELDKK